MFLIDETYTTTIRHRIKTENKLEYNSSSISNIIADGYDVVYVGWMEG